MRRAVAVAAAAVVTPPQSTYEKPLCGPIIGHTSAHGTHVWVQGKYEKKKYQYAIMTMISIDDDTDVVDYICVALPHATEYSAVVRIGTHNMESEMDEQGGTYFCNLFQHQRNGTIPLEPLTDYKVACTIYTIDEQLPTAKMDAHELFRRSTTATRSYATFRTFAGGDLADESVRDRGLALTQEVHIGRGWLTWVRDIIHDTIHDVYELMTGAQTDGMVHEHDQWLAELVVPPIPAARIGLVFFAGSCHYPKKREVSDLIFGTIQRHMQHVLQTGTDLAPFMLMMGDQIYADALSRHIPLSLADTAREFRKLYQKKYAGKHMRRLLASAPVYMCMDDHEIEDGWHRERLQESKYSELRWNEPRALFNTAIQAYTIYQSAHSPCGYAPEKLWYTFQNGSYPFFVLDTRTARSPSTGKLVDDAQLHALLVWIDKHPATVPKFVVSSTAIAPSTPGKSKSSWADYPVTRDALLKHFAVNHTRNVVFLAGDLHCSLACTMTLQYENNNKRAVFHSIVSSPLYWPYPFADGAWSDLVPNSRVGKNTVSLVYKPKDGPANRLALDYEVHRTSYTQGNNFARIAVEEDVHGRARMLHVQWFSVDGTQLSQCKLGLQ